MLIFLSFTILFRLHTLSIKEDVDSDLALLSSSSYRVNCFGMLSSIAAWKHNKLNVHDQQKLYPPCLRFKIGLSKASSWTEYNYHIITYTDKKLTSFFFASCFILLVRVPLATPSLWARYSNTAYTNIYNVKVAPLHVSNECSSWRCANASRHALLHSKNTRVL